MSLSIVSRKLIFLSDYSRLMPTEKPILTTLIVPIISVKGKQVFGFSLITMSADTKTLLFLPTDRHS